MRFLCFECGRNLDESIFYNKVKNRCKDCLNKKLKCQVSNMFFPKKWLTSLSEREHHSSESNVDNKNNDNTTPQQLKINSYNNNDIVLTCENHAYAVIGPTNVGKTYYMLKILEKKGNRILIHIIIRSHNRYPNYKKL